jgi:signal transduction histidine kinase/CheY-like chemotaxis protein
MPKKRIGEELRRGFEQAASRLNGYGPALAGLGAAAAVHFLMQVTIGAQRGWEFFVYIVAMLAGAWCGFGPGLLVSFLTVAVLPYWYRPGFSVRQLEPGGVAALTLLALLVSTLARSLRRAREGLDARVKETTEELRVSEEQFRTFLTHFPGAAFLRDAKGRYVFGGSGWTPAEGDDDVLSAGRPVQRVEEDRSGGHVRYWLVNRFPMTGPDGARLVGGTALEITETRRLEEQLAQAQKMEAIGQLAGGVAHDFNNLLTVINGYATLLMERVASPEDAKQLRSIAEAGERAAALTRQLLAFGRKQVLHPRDSDINAIIRKMESMVERLIPASIGIEVRLHPELRTVYVDPIQIEQVLLNLVVNARDAMPGGGRLVVETANTALDEHYAATHPGVEPGEYAVISVSDDGAGIAPEVQRSVFDPFFTTKAEGTGLGLATVYGIVKQSRGHIFLYSEPGEGTTFKLYFPATGRPAETVEEEPEEITGGGERVLLVEDDERVREFCATILQEAGYGVSIAGDGRQAMDALAEGSGVDLLITDVVLPRIGGPELAAVARERNPGMKVLYVSGYTESTVTGHGVRNGKDSFLPKPYTRQQLLGAIRRVLKA